MPVDFVFSENKKRNYTKISLGSDEEYPVYFIDENPDSELQIPTERYEWISKIIEAYREVQSYLSELSHERDEAKKDKKARALKEMRQMQKQIEEKYGVELQEFVYQFLD